MTKLAWATDIHLDFLDASSPSLVREFAGVLFKDSPNAVVISGDISIGQDLERHLGYIDQVATCPVYFVCGNHDYYDTSVTVLREMLRTACSSSKNLNYLTLSDHFSINGSTAIVGHDGWYDGLHGNPHRSGFVMTDWIRIWDFADAGAVRRVTGMYSGGPACNMGVILGISRKLADDAAQHVFAKATAAAATHENVIIVTHVPPFEDAHVHNGVKGSPEAMPWYTSRLMGEALLQLSENHPETRFNVLCGHTHGRKSISIRPNLSCHVGGAEYGSPAVNSVEVA